MKVREKSLLLAAIFGVLGVANLAVMNLWLVPAAWPDGPAAAEAPAASPAASKAAVAGASDQAPPVDRGPAKVESRAAVVPPPPADEPPAKPVAAPQPPEPPPPATKPAAEKILPDEPPPELDEVPGINFLQFHYGQGQCQVTDTMKQELDPVLERLRQQADLVVHIEGHSDPSGSPSGHYNMSALRAGFAAAYFEKMGVKEGRIKQHLRGAAAAKLMPPSMWHKNRRVVVRIFKPR